MYLQDALPVHGAGRIRYPKQSNWYTPPNVATPPTIERKNQPPIDSKSLQRLSCISSGLPIMTLCLALLCR